MIIMNPNVGVAPGTTTMQLGEQPTLWWPYENAARLRGLNTIEWPYGDVTRLRGLGAVGAPRWGLVLVAGIAAFSIMLVLRRRSRRR